MIRSILYIFGVFFTLIDKLRYQSLLVYKTQLINKNGSMASWVGPETQFSFPENIHVGKNTYINGGMICAGKKSKIYIGSNCLISYNVHIRTDMHNYKKKDELIINQGHYEMDIRIEDDVWIGYGSQIFAGITIGKGAVVAAGSIVTKSVPDYTVVAGIPAVKIKLRGIN